MGPGAWGLALSAAALQLKKSTFSFNSHYLLFLHPIEIQVGRQWSQWEILKDHLRLKRGCQLGFVITCIQKICMEKEIWILKLIGEITGPGFSGEIVLVFNNPSTPRHVHLPLRLWWDTRKELYLCRESRHRVEDLGMLCCLANYNSCESSFSIL